MFGRRQDGIAAFDTVTGLLNVTNRLSVCPQSTSADE
jgi:hypothetical protein